MKNMPLVTVLCSSQANRKKERAYKNMNNKYNKTESENELINAMIENIQPRSVNDPSIMMTRHPKLTQKDLEAIRNMQKELGLKIRQDQLRDDNA